MWRLYKKTIFLSLFFAIGNAQEAPITIRLTQPITTPIVLTNAPLSSFITELTAKTNLAICVEDVWPGSKNNISDLSLTFASSRGEDIQSILNRLQLSYPLLIWTTRDGIIILKAAELSKLRDDPLKTAATPIQIRGNFEDVKSYLTAGISGFNPAILEAKGAIDHKRIYEMRVRSGMAVADVLTLLTTKYGLRWHAAVRVERSQTEASVVLSFTEGKVPSRLQSDETTELIRHEPIILPRQRFTAAHHEELSWCQDANRSACEPTVRDGQDDQHAPQKPKIESGDPSRG